MGGCTSKTDRRELYGEKRGTEADKRRAEAKVSKEIDNQAQKEHVQQSRIFKLLLLGAGESGKSTLFRQMKRIYGTGFSKQEIEFYKKSILANTIFFMETLLNAFDDLDVQSSKPLQADLVPLRTEFRRRVLGESAYDARMGILISELWADPSLRHTFDLRSKYQLPDCASHFFSRAPKLAEPTYIPSDADILLSRVRTTGIVETRFKINGTEFDIFDVGGQRNERKKWIHCFENVTAVIFVIALSEYDQVLFECEHKNRMREALELFDETVNSKWFTKIDIIVFMNKIDVLAEKIVKVPIKKYFPDFDGGEDLSAALHFFKRQVQFKNRIPTRAIYCHFTTATNEANVISVFRSVKDIVMRKNISNMGLI